MLTLPSLVCADMPEEFAAKVEEASKETLQDLTTALCKNTEVTALGSDFVHSPTQCTADLSTSIEFRHAPGMCSECWMARGRLPDSKTLCHAGSIDNTFTMHTCRLARGCRGRLSRPCLGWRLLLGQLRGSLTLQRLRWTAASQETRLCLQGADPSAMTLPVLLACTDGGVGGPGAMRKALANAAHTEVLCSGSASILHCH